MTLLRYISTHLTFQVSQGSVATNLRWGENFNKLLFDNSFLNIVVKKLWKSVNICQSYRKNKRGTFFLWPTVYIYSHLMVSSMTAITNRYQKGKTILDFSEAKDDGVAMASAEWYAKYLHFRQITTPASHHPILQAGWSSCCQPTVSKHWRPLLMQ